MGRSIVVANQKGGVGKTTTVVNLAASIALEKQNVLVLDNDPQGNASSGLGFARHEIARSLYDVYTGKHTLEDVIVPTGVPNLFLAPADINLLAVEVELVDREHREYVLKKALEPLKERYSFILIDCPPSLGLLTLNGMVAADSMIVPVQCEYYSLEGLSLLSRTLSLVRGSFNPSLDIEGIVLTMFDSRNTLSHQVAAEVKKHFPDKVYEAQIPRNVTLGEAPSHGKPAVLYDPRSKGAQSYLALAMEMLYEERAG
ncbi:MAG TPA: ParA family protein [Dissulfurispiraceae bacterium]|nr:ParA family protein [Dissulfurispiraceae bacterium]